MSLSCGMVCYAAIEEPYRERIERGTEFSTKGYRKMEQ